MTQEDKDRYEQALHAMQSGVAMQMNWDAKDTTPKHLRVGVNAALVDSSALAQLLMNKGIITEDEYFSALADMAEFEVKRYEEIINDHFGGSNVTLE